MQLSNEELEWNLKLSPNVSLIRGRAVISIYEMKYWTIILSKSTQGLLDPWR